MSDINVVYKLTKPQRIIYDSLERTRLFVAGRGSGKSYLSAVIQITYALSNPNTIILVVSTTHNISRNVNQKLFLSLCPSAAISDYNKSLSEILLINGSVVLFRSANNERDIDNLRSLSVHAVFIDEAAVMSPYVYDVVLPMIREGTDEQQKLVITSTPKMNWLWEKFKKTTPKNCLLLDEINSNSNTNLTPGFIQSLEDEFGGTPWYDSEIKGMWVKQSGLVYDVKVVEHFKLPYRFDRYVYAVDWGFSAPAVILVFGISEGKIYVVNEYYKPHTIDEDILIELELLYKAYGRGQVFCDPAQPQSIEFLKRAKIPAIPANNKRNEGMRTVRNLFDTGQLFVSDKCLNTIIEGNQFSYAKDATDDKLEGDDHAMDTLRYGCMGISGRNTNLHIF